MPQDPSKLSAEEQTEKLEQFRELLEVARAQPDVAHLSDQELARTLNQTQTPLLEAKAEDSDSELPSAIMQPTFDAVEVKDSLSEGEEPAMKRRRYKKQAKADPADPEAEEDPAEPGEIIEPPPWC